MAQMPGSVVVMNLSSQKPYTRRKLSGRVHIPIIDQQGFVISSFPRRTGCLNYCNWSRHLEGTGCHELLDE